MIAEATYFVPEHLKVRRVLSEGKISNSKRIKVRKNIYYILTETSRERKRKLEREKKTERNTKLLFPNISTSFGFLLEGSDLK